MSQIVITFCSIFIILLSYSHSASSQENNLKPSNLSVSFNGTFENIPLDNQNRGVSENGTYCCHYQIGNASDEFRELLDFRFYENDQLLFTLAKAPGSDLYISNAGYLAFMDLQHHYKRELTIHFYSKRGLHLFSQKYKGAFLFGFSSKGEKFGVGTPSGLHIISIHDQSVITYDRGYQFDISEDENFVAIARKGSAEVYSNGKLFKEFKTGFDYTRKIKISSDILAIIDKRHLKVYSLVTADLLFSDRLIGKESFRDLFLTEGKILAGIHYRDENISKGILKIYDSQGKIFLHQEQSCKQIKNKQSEKILKKSTSGYGEIPWPFAPFDSMCTVWNYYEQHMGLGVDPQTHEWSSYLHQGLDIITPIGEPTYAVAGGIVKCVLTLGGTYYWRMATSEQLQDGYSDGWLYAHLIQSTIQFDVLDTVNIYDYLGDIVEWTSEWGHIHLARIRDSGLVWQYEDNEWGIVYNPLMSLKPDSDWVTPIIENVFENSKFAFCKNETSEYLDPDSLYGDVDIIAKIRDFVGDSEWEQPAFRTYYWIKKISSGNVVFPRTLGQILNHAYAFYEYDRYIPYAPLIYKRDFQLKPSSWMGKQRDYYHILTNNNGDSLIDLSEMDLAFATTDYPDGDYRFFVQAFDEYGNSTVDSMDVSFKNGINSVSTVVDCLPNDFRVMQNYPNPFNPATEISYILPISGFVVLRVYDILGREVKTLVNQIQRAGDHTIEFHANGLPCGIYLYKLEVLDAPGRTRFFQETRKMLLMK